MLALSNFARPAVFTVAGLILTLTAISVQRSVASQKTPNESTVTYKLGPGATKLIKAPAASKSIFVMGSNTTSGDRGVGHVAMLHITGAFLEWVGLDSASSGTITQGFSAAQGTHIVQIDFGGLVNLKVNNADSFIVANTGTFTQTGNVTMIW
ncbi:MAG TPA: hypothetical protein VFW40_04045 [Capsulimonadaceae bacterium]|nr:hypothetical protein [Capsulimonadaceae bacterium]